MKTTHRFERGDARAMGGVADASVGLVVTSPPYPLIEMWDAAFEGMAPGVSAMLAAGEGWRAFEAMHAELDRAWAECARVLVPGGLCCVNIGDATRTLGGQFALYPNHARVVSAMLRLGMTPLPDILWRKPTNAPNKFMGSGMLPAGAYVTYEHEYILVFRRGGKRTEFSPGSRQASAYLWEERNAWFSDSWSDVRGTRQARAGARDRSAAFPFEIPYRLVAMYSVQGDVVLDPFCGTGTTMVAAMALGRSSVGVDVDGRMAVEVDRALRDGVALARARGEQRFSDHREFVRARRASGKALAHSSSTYGFPVMTAQERRIRWLWPRAVAPAGEGRWEVECEEAAEEPGLLGGG